MKKSEALNTLGLAQGASEEDIKKAHRKLIIENHPDKFGQDEQARAKAEEKTKLINEARDVLLNHSWDPEYSTSGTPYGAPFSYNPSAGRPQNAQGNPFEGWPFTESFVWTTWDENGNKTTYTSTGGNPFQGNPFGANPFSWTDPFDMGVRMRAILAPTGQGDVPTKATSGVATLLPIRRIPLREQCSISAHSFRMPPQQKNCFKKQKPIYG